MGNCCLICPVDKYYYQVNSADSHSNRATSTEDNLTTTAGDQTITRTVTVGGGGGVSSYAGVDPKDFEKVKSERDKLLKEKDITPPKIKKVSISDIKPFSAILDITTDEDSQSNVRFGESDTNLNRSAH